MHDELGLLARSAPGDPDPEELLRELLRRTAWHAHAVCRGMGPDAFFPGHGDPAAVARAKAVCAACIVAELCAEAGAGEVDGIWGGQSGRTRRLIRSRSAPAA